MQRDGKTEQNKMPPIGVTSTHTQLPHHIQHEYDEEAPKKLQPKKAWPKLRL